MAMRGGRRSALASASGIDNERQRQLNAEAPRIPHLRRRIAALFLPYKLELGVTIALVLVSAGVTVALPLITRNIFDKALFPASGQPNMRLLGELVGLTVLLIAIVAIVGIAQTWFTTRVGSRVMGICACSSTSGCKPWRFPSLPAPRPALFSRACKTMSAESRMC